MSANLIRRTTLVELHILLNTLCIQHMTHLTTTIDLINLGSIEQVHLCVFRPSIDTIASTVNRSKVALCFIRPHGRRNVHLCEESSALAVVTAVDGTRHKGCLVCVPIVHDGLDNIARRQNLSAKGSTENLFDFNSRFLGHIHQGACCHALIITAAIGITHLTVKQVDNCRTLITIKTRAKNLTRKVSHTQTVVTAGAEDFSFREVSGIVGDINEHVTMIQRLVAITVLRIARTTAKNANDVVLVVGLRTDVHKGILQVRHLTADIIFGVVIIGIVATVNGIYATHDIFHIGAGLQQTGIAV